MVRALVSRLGRLVLPVPMEVVILPPTVFIPFVAELSVREGSWAALKSHLDRPAKAASEAVRTRLGVQVPCSVPPRTSCSKQSRGSCRST